MKITDIPKDYTISEEEFDKYIIIDYLRKERGIDIVAMPCGYNDKYFYEIRKNKQDLITVSEEYNTYDAAINNGLTYIKANKIC